jgi:hypothetical protein
VTADRQTVVRRVELYVAVLGVLDALDIDPATLPPGRLDVLAQELAKFRTQVQRRETREQAAFDSLFHGYPPRRWPDTLLEDVDRWRPGYADLLRELWNGWYGDTREGKIEALLADGSGATAGELEAARAALARIRKGTPA